MLNRNSWLALLLTLIHPLLSAEQMEDLTAVEQRLKTTFTNLKASHFQPSEIPGIYEILAGNRLIYYLPAQELLLFGEFFDKEGRSLTAEKRAKFQREKVKALTIDKALTIGEGDKVVIEFTDPDCPYCQRLHKQLHNENQVKRIIFFSIDDSLHPEASRKAVHILCSKDPKSAFDQIVTYKLNRTDLLDCAHGRETLALHQAISSEFGISGTPTVVLGTTVVQGYREAQIAQYLAANQGE